MLGTACCVPTKENAMKASARAQAESTSDPRPGFDGADGITAVGTPCPAAPPFVSTVEEFCRGNLRRPIGVADMARVAGMSRFHFIRVFARASGVSPGRYLAKLRLEESLRLIREGGHTLKGVAEVCGYGDTNYFSKCFRRTFGVAPGAFRNAMRQASLPAASSNG
jgi:AraC-like DNA-binding protein